MILLNGWLVLFRIVVFSKVETWCFRYAARITLTGTNGAYCRVQRRI